MLQIYHFEIGLKFQPFIRKISECFLQTASDLSPTTHRDLKIKNALCCHVGFYLLKNLIKGRQLTFLSQFLTIEPEKGPAKTSMCRIIL